MIFIADLCYSSTLGLDTLSDVLLTVQYHSSIICYNDFLAKLISHHMH